MSKDGKRQKILKELAVGIQGGKHPTEGMIRKFRNLMIANGTMSRLQSRAPHFGKAALPDDHW